mgnify:CR=1 FL=1|tara:strand:+ start:618 stop:1412 length:795 start_codon:yes stop_codon:yes gene_type:complete
MSEHKESLVKVLEYIVNDEQDKAADLLHNVFVEKAKNHWSSLQENDEIVEDDIAEDDLDETIDLDEADDDDNEEEVEEAIDASDAEEDFLDDIETAEEEIDQEEIMDDEDMEGDEAEMELAMDMEPEADGGDEPADAEEAMDNVEDAIAELRAAFSDMMGDEEPSDDDDMEMESVEAMEEGAKLSAVSVSHSDSSDKGSPVASNAKAPNDAKAHPTDTTEEAGASAPAVKDMGVTGPQEAGSPKAAPAPKREAVKSDSPIRGMK